jgi:uncharacterized protein (DUF58 family)
LIPHRSILPAALTPVEKKPSFDFSLVGLTYTCMILFMGLAAMNSQVNLLFGVFGLMMGVLLVSGFVSRSVLRKVVIRRLLPEYLVTGQPASLRYEFSNRKRLLPSLSVTVGELSGVEAFVRQPQAYLLHAAAGMSATVPVEVVPKRRGVHQFDRFQLSTSFPFGFIKRAINLAQKDSVLVHPALAQVDPKLLEMFLSAEQGGSHMKPRRGGADEFYGLKEYRQGENPRWICWRRSARTGELVAREMSHVAPPRLLVLVDTLIAERSLAAHAAVERCIAMAASLVVHALDQGLAVGMGVYSGQSVVIAPSRGKRHQREVLSILSRLPLNTTCDLNALLDSSRKLLHDSTTRIVFTPADMAPTLSEQARGRWVVICANSELARRSFRFGPEINFEQCIPPEQLPGKEK